MTHHVTKTVQLGLVIVAAALLAACSEATSAQAEPAWSPPAWLHGTWKTAASDLGSGTLKASRYNVEIDIQISGATSSYDFAQLDEDGVASIEYEVGVDADSGLRFYFIAIDAADGSATGFTFYRLSADEIEGYLFVWPAGGVRTDSDAFYLTKS